MIFTNKENEARPAGSGQGMVLFGVLFLVAGWKIGALFVGSEIILPGPVQTIKKLFSVALSPGFFPALQATTLRGLGAFLVSAAAGLSLGVASGLSGKLRNLLKPLIVTIRSTPVMSFILLALIWFPSGLVPVFVAVLMAFPIMYENVVTGILSVDPRLIEMAKVYRVPGRRILSQILLPGLFAFFMAGARTGLGIIWKAVIAAEILARPSLAVGSSMYEAKIYIETAEVVAWTVAAVLISAITEYLLQRSALLVRGVRRGGVSL